MDKLVVCDPRRNRLISDDGDKDDPIDAAKRELGRLAASQPVVASWSELPGVGLIRAITLLAYLDTPWRFKKLSKLWKYCGVGLERSASGTDRHGKPKPPHLQLAWRVNRRLKNAVVGATMSAIRQKDNPLARMYQRLVQAGLTAGNARHAAARKLVAVLWGMWKNSSRYQPDRVQGGRKAIERQRPRQRPRLLPGKKKETTRFAMGQSVAGVPGVPMGGPAGSAPRV